MEQQDKNIGTLLGDIGCEFRRNIDAHIKDYQLQKGNDVEWLLEPLDAIRHPADIVIDAFQYGSRWESFYQLYFHDKKATMPYVAYDMPFKEPSLTKMVGNTIIFLEPKEIEEAPTPNAYNKTMIIKETLDYHAANYIPLIWKDLIVPFTEIGIWQAVLLNETEALFPKGWHGNYLNKTYIFSKEDIQLISDGCKGLIQKCSNRERFIAYLKPMGYSAPLKYDFSKSDYEKLLSHFNRDDIMPSFEINADKAVVSFSYWSKWRGLCRKIIPVEMTERSIIIGDTEHEVLVKYSCGIRY